eukprot:GABV01000103.1.p1 GENE.GABV01000103.1~~GABV01000103.1.p1  ORF type:complete len:258 (-),score=92.33 GABV01000103.1:681-1454(-)
MLLKDAQTKLKDNWQANWETIKRRAQLAQHPAQSEAEAQAAIQTLRTNALYHLAGLLNNNELAIRCEYEIFTKYSGGVPYWDAAIIPDTTKTIDLNTVRTNAYALRIGEVYHGLAQNSAVIAALHADTIKPDQIAAMSREDFARRNAFEQARNNAKAMFIAPFGTDHENASQATSMFELELFNTFYPDGVQGSTIELKPAYCEHVIKSMIFFQKQPMYAQQLVANEISATQLVATIRAQDLDALPDPAQPGATFSDT